MTQMEIAARFSPDNEIIDVRPLGNGNVNDTYLVETGRGGFVLQRINQHVFPRPDWIMENARMLTDHCAPQLVDSHWQ